jgi:hypothetical protein
LNQSAKLQDLPNEAEPEEPPKETREAQDASSQQKACDEQTIKFADFKNIGDRGLYKNAYANNYDASTDKCYAMIIVRPISPSYPGHYYSINDASSIDGEGSKYGWCDLYRDGTVDSGAFGGCFILPDGSPDKKITCRSEEEFNDLALKYFGINARTAYVYSYDKNSNDGTNDPNKPASSSKSLTVEATTTTVTIARNYYQQLFDAGGFSGILPSYVCLSDDDQSGTFFTIRANAYDESYYNAQAKVQAGVGQIKVGNSDSFTLTPEGKQQFDTMEAIQRTAPYLTFLMKGLLESFPPKAQQFFRSGGRILEENVYDKGVKTNTLEYLWDGSSWYSPIPPTDPKAYTRISKILHLSIEPATMRYVESTVVTITVGNGDTAATDTTRYGPRAGICEKVPNPKYWNNYR